MNRTSPVGMMLQFAFGPGPANAAAASGPASPVGTDLARGQSPQWLA